MIEEIVYALYEVSKGVLIFDSKIAALRRNGRSNEADLVAEIEFLKATGTTLADLSGMKTREENMSYIPKGLYALLRYFINGNNPEFIMVYFDSAKNGNRNLMMDVWYNGNKRPHRINVIGESRESLSKAIEYLRTEPKHHLPIVFNG